MSAELKNGLTNTEKSNSMQNYRKFHPYFFQISGKELRERARVTLLRSLLAVSSRTLLQDRLSDLAILSIESQQARQMDITDILKDFAQKNARRKGRFGGF